MSFFQYIYRYVAALLSVVLCLFTSVPSIIKQGAEEKEKNIVQQIERIEQLEQDYASGNYVKVNENSFADFELQEAYDSGVKINEISCIGTHNSYQLASVPAYQELMDNLSIVTFGLVSSVKPKFSSDTLTEQFNVGVRSIELDIETVVTNGEISFVCNHSPVFDMTTTCYNFELALKEVAMWSDANPNHVPITIIIEPKTAFLPDGNMKYMNLTYANALDDMLRRVLGDRLMTPADAMGDYESLKQMREADAWPTLQEAAGKVLVLLHDTTVTDQYIRQDESIKTQAMFPMLRYDDIDKSYASFIIMNDPEDAKKHSEEVIGEKKLIVRTRADTFSDVDEETISCAMESGAQIVSTDHPPKTDMTGIETVTSFGGYMIRLNRRAL